MPDTYIICTDVSSFFRKKLSLAAGPYFSLVDATTKFASIPAEQKPMLFKLIKEKT